MKTKRHTPFLALLFALAAAGGAQAQTPGARLDAAGIALGMSQAQAVAAAAKSTHLTPLQQSGIEGQFMRNDLPQPILLFLSASSKDPSQGLESIYTYMTSQPASPSVWRVIRTVNYANDKRPAVSVLQSSLKEKYGAAPTQTEANGNLLTWVYTTAGTVVTGAQGADLIKRCTKNGWQRFDMHPRQVNHEFLKLVNYANDRARTAPPAECAKHRFAQARISPTGDGAQAGALNVALVDMALGLPALDATLKMIDQTVANARQQQTQQSQQIKPSL